ncbi:MAG TPA: DUF4340 domain-containing protein [Dokdonella sp.]|uniref:DUF4340 domain-containing protein n=1 Tax=Dokdonella sp. TaxID=2291710 RepID=UPI002CEA6C1A|nr:DUF4340 domain-containing protein [Dokdonella sp.]HUD43415.1 DUF4340 domain-containing protein [Dokdonella sp.]
MNARTLAIVAVVTLAALAAAIGLNHTRKPATELRSEPLVPGLKDEVNAISKLSLIGAGNAPLVVLERKDAGWVVANRDGYPADSGKLREFVLKLADATVLEPKTASQDRYPAIGVEDVAAADAKGVRVEIDGPKTPVRLIVGTFNGAGGGGTFVRRADEAQSFLASGTLTPEKNPTEWLSRDLVDVPAAQIAEVTIEKAGKTLRVFKQDAAEENFRIADLPKGREASSPAAANPLASGLAGLRIDGARPASAAAAPASAVKARYAAFDGRVVEVTAWQADGKHYAQFAASLDEARADAHAEAAQAQAKAAQPAPADAAAAEGQPAADAERAAGDSAAAAADAAPDRAARLAAVRTEVEALQRRFAGWAFEIPAHKYASFDKSIDDLLKPADAKPAKK